MPRSFVEQACARCSVPGSRLWFNCNPEGPQHWFYQEWILQAEQRRALYLHFTMEDNPALTPRIRARYRRAYSGVFYRRFVRGSGPPPRGWCTTSSTERASRAEGPFEAWCGGQWSTAPPTRPPSSVGQKEAFGTWTGGVHYDSRRTGRQRPTGILEDCGPGGRPDDPAGQRGPRGGQLYPGPAAGRIFSGQGPERRLRRHPGDGGDAAGRTAGDLRGLCRPAAGDGTVLLGGRRGAGRSPEGARPRHGRDAVFRHGRGGGGTGRVRGHWRWSGGPCEKTARKTGMGGSKVEVVSKSGRSPRPRRCSCGETGRHPFG
jgi:hypothetical protein